MNTDTEFREADGQLYQQGEGFEPYVSPTTAAKRGLLSKYERRCVLQNRVHYVLNDFLNGNDTHSLEFVETLLSAEGIPVESTDPIDIIITYYTHSDKLLPSAESTVTISPGPFNDEQYDGNEIEREVQTLVDAIQQLDDYLAGGYVHGSFGDKEYVRNYSDVDTLVVISGETLVDSDALTKLKSGIQRLAQYYYYIDPHQHHGTMVAAEPDLRSYNRAYLPPVALSHGKSICTRQEDITFHIREDQLERTHSFWRMLQTLRQCVVDSQFPSPFAGAYLTGDCEGPLYCLKHFTSLVMLLPSIYMTAVDEPTYKADSFSTGPLTDTDETAVIDRCSDVRSRYPELVSFRRDGEYRQALRQDAHLARTKYQQKAVPADIWDILGNEYFEDALQAGEYLWNQI